MNLNNYLNYLKINVGSQNTRIQYLSRMAKFFNQYNEFNQENVNSYLASTVDEGRKASTFNSYKYTFVSYSKFSKVAIEFPKDKRKTKSKKRFLR